MKSLIALTLVSLSAWAQDYQQLRVEEAKADSFLQSNWNRYQENYHPNYAFDGNPATAWVEGVEGNGEGATLLWEVSKLETASSVKLRVRNGYQKSKALFRANSSVKDAVVILIGKQMNFQTAKKITLKQEMGWQEFEFPLEDNHGLTGLKFAINSAYEGKSYKDTCVSDIEVWVKSKVPYNAALEQEKHARLIQWTKDRLKAAKFFANAPGTYPFAGTKFKKTSERQYYPVSMKGSEYVGSNADFFDTEPPANFLYASELNEVLSLQQKYGIKTGEKPSWYKVVLDKTKVASFRPDGLEAGMFNDYSTDLYSDVLMRFMRAENVSLFETKQEVALRFENDYSRQDQKAVITYADQVSVPLRRDEKPSPGMTSKKLISNAKVTKEDGQVRALAYWVEDSGMERGPYKYFNTYLYVYQDGLLQWAIRNQQGMKFSYNAQGKVEKVLEVGHVKSEYDEAPYYWYIYDVEAAKVAGSKP